MRRFFKKVHLWLSIPAGLIISAVCITGAILSFETEILEKIYPERYFVEEKIEIKIPINELIPIVNQQLENNSVASMKISADPGRTYVASLSHGFRVSAFVNPYTGKVTGVYNYKESFFFQMMSLHRWLMDGTRTWGKYTVGIATLLFVFILISGVVWWIPKDRKKLKSRFRIKLNKGWRRFFHDLHVALGIYACLLLLICSLTGLMWSFNWYRTGVARIFGLEVTPSSPKKEIAEKKEIDSSKWQQVYDEINQQVPDNIYISISDGGITLLTKDAPHLRATDRYLFNDKTGKITKKELFFDRNDTSKAMAWAYAFHVGAIGGMFVRILTCLACIVGGTLPLTGYYLFYVKRKKRKIES